MRILISTQHRAIVGGVETYLRSLLPELISAGHTVAVVCEHTDFEADRRIDADVPGIRVAGIDSRLEAFVRDFDPETIYNQGLFDPEVQGWLSHFAPTLTYVHVHEGNCISGTRRYSRPHETICERRFGLGCLLHYLPRGCGGSSPTTMLSLYRQQTRKRALWPTFRGLAVASRYMLDELLRGGADERRLHLLPLFPSGIEPGPELDVRSPGGELLFVGRLTTLKGVIYAIRAVESLVRKGGRAYRLTVAGEGSERAGLERYVRERSLPVTFLGAVGAARRNELFREADLLVVPSIWGEPFGLVGIEAGCAGLPTAGFAAGGIVDWLIPGETGELARVDPPTPEGLAGAIERALEEPTRYGRLRVGAWRRAAEYSRAGHVGTLLNHLQSCLEAEPV